MSIDVFPATVLNSTLWNGQTYEEGTFAVTATGFSGTAPSGTAWYVRVGKQVTLTLPHIEGTSNATTFTLTGLPTLLVPAANFFVSLMVADNSVYQSFSGTMRFAAGSAVITIVKDSGGAPWTASGIKVVVETSVAYICQ
jgi:hypothetical protein